MKQAYEVVAALEATDGRKDKEQILIDAFMNGIYDFFVGAQYACDELISFGVKQVANIAPEDLDPENPGTISFKDFITLAKKLQKRELTGHAARDAINEMALACHGPTWNFFYRRVLLKDLRCGAERSTINKILDRCSGHAEAIDLKIPVFSPQLAVDGRKPPHDKKLKGKKYLQLKLDGCLSSEWEIEFEDGKKVKISEVVGNKISGKIKSKNISTGSIEYNEIVGWAKDDTIASDGNQPEWFVITLEGGRELPPLTGNHLVWLPKLKCWRRADLLKAGDVLLSDKST